MGALLAREPRTPFLLQIILPPGLPRTLSLIDWASARTGIFSPNAFLRAFHHRCVQPRYCLLSRAPVPPLLIILAALSPEHLKTTTFNGSPQDFTAYESGIFSDSSSVPLCFFNCCVIDLFLRVSQDARSILTFSSHVTVFRVLLHQSPIGVFSYYPRPPLSSISYLHLPYWRFLSGSIPFS